MQANAAAPVLRADKVEKGDGPAHLPALDGWRAISILAVLAGHMLPLGPKNWALNGAVATTGMSLFFILSGFLITNILLRNAAVVPFLIRRIFRIVPLAWPFLIVVLWMAGADAADWTANLLFYANLPPFHLDQAGHFWSLCVEMQFYAAIALVMLMLGRRGLFLVPLAALAVTVARVATGTEISIVTWFRVDDILAGGCLALLRHRKPGLGAGNAIVPWMPYLLGPLLLASAHGEVAVLGYARPYLAAALIGVTLVQAHGWLAMLLASRPMRYVARISYALYVIHPMTVHGWMNEGDTLTRYAKRPLSFALSFAFAHLSSFYWEKWWIRRGHRLAQRFE